MFDLEALQTSSTNPTFTTIVFSVVLALVLSSAIVITYDLTTRSMERNHNYLQSLALISILATMVMQAVGDSLARGLGMLGALAIIRFRTTLRDPRNMTFMFASLAVGICCGALGFTIAAVGTVIFCAMAFVLKYSSFGKYENLVGDLRIVANNVPEVRTRLEKIISPFTSSLLIKDYRMRNVQVPIKSVQDQLGKIQVVERETVAVKEFSYDLKMKQSLDQDEMLSLISEQEYIREVKLRFSRKEIEL